MILNGDINSPLGGGTQGYGIGIHPRNSDSTDAIGRSLGSDFQVLYPRHNGVINAGETHNLSVDHIGPDISVFLDGNLYMSATDPAPLQGGSIYVRFFGPGTVDDIQDSRGARAFNRNQRAHRDRIPRRLHQVSALSPEGGVSTSF